MPETNVDYSEDEITHTKLNVYADDMTLPHRSEDETMRECHSY
jgi:hypothetical protein